MTTLNTDLVFLNINKKLFTIKHPFIQTNLKNKIKN